VLIARAHRSCSSLLSSLILIANTHRSYSIAPTRCYSSLLLIAATHRCYSSLLLIAAAHRYYSSLLLIAATHRCYSSLLLIAATHRCYSSLLLIATAHRYCPSLLLIAPIYRPSSLLLHRSFSHRCNTSLLITAPHRFYSRSYSSSSHRLALLSHWSPYTRPARLTMCALINRLTSPTSMTTWTCNLGLRTRTSRSTSGMTWRSSLNRACT
jgi:hypothetical protein